MKSYKIITDASGVVELANYITQGNIIAYDTETTSVNPRQGDIIGFSVSANLNEGYYFPTKVWNNDTQTIDDLNIEGKRCEDIAVKLIKLLIGKKLVMHNASFDIRYTKNCYDIDLRDSLYCDTMLLRHTLKEDGPFGLKDIAIELQNELGIDAEKEANEEQIRLKESIKANGGQTTKANYELYKADMQILGEYAAADTDLTLRVMTHYLPILKEENLWDFFFVDEVMPLYRTVTIQMEEKGSLLDMELIREMDRQITNDITNLEKEVVDALMKLPEAKRWALERAHESFPPKKRGNFAKKLLDYKNRGMMKNESGIDEFLADGDAEHLDPMDSMRVSLDLLKEKEGGLINISSKKQLGELCFDYLGIKPLTKTRKGNNQFNEGLVDHLSKDYEWAAKMKDYNKLNKIKSSYIDRFNERSEDGRYYFYVKQHGTTSGRFSSDSQQLPRILEPGEASPLVLKYNNIVRKFVKSEDDRRLVICDQSSLEPRVFASVSNDPGLINVFKNGEDLYSRVAIQAWKLEGMSAVKSDDNYLKKLRPDLRQRAKSIALAIPYGAGAWQIGKQLNIHIKEAQKMINGYLEGFPELAKWMSDTHLRANTIGKIVNKTGRIRHLDKVKYIYEKFEDNLIKPWVFKGMKEQARRAGNEKELQQLRMEYKNGLNNAKNFQIQSLAASIMNRSAIRIHEEFKKQNIDAYIMLQIHDEFVVNASAEHAEKAAEITKHCMENTVSIETGLVAEPNIATDFAEGHV
jgi:DNA polymerase I-like protein with 3'-5' exonuclease and polymerase domains